MTTRAVSLPRKGGPQVTDRDLQILAWITLHGVVTPDQVARHFFRRSSGGVGIWAAYRRLRKLTELGLLRKDPVFWRHPSVLRVTGAGARLANVGIAPARLVPAEVGHALAVVDLLEQLRPVLKPGTEITTERELRIQRRTRRVANPRLKGRGRMPDAVLSWDGHQTALELDRTNKRTFDYERIVHAYLQEPYDKVWWYVRRAAAPRLRAVVRQNRATDLIDVRVWEG